jgi:hypothetical protein
MLSLRGQPVTPMVQGACTDEVLRISALVPIASMLATTYKIRRWKRKMEATVSSLNQTILEVYAIH